MSTLAEAGSVPRVRRNRRRNYLVRPAFQLRFAVSAGLTVFLASSMISFGLYTALHQQARQRMMQPDTYTAEVPLVVLGFALLLAAVTAGAFAGWCILFTHRICGPLVVMDRYLNELAEGRFPEVRFLRKRDELKDLFVTLRRAISRLKQDAAPANRQE
jgi:hypothetical protein